jgi:hypothetical protein
MENSAYVPNPLPPPALVVFSQAGGLPEALRMQRPFNPQVCLQIFKLMKNYKMWPINHSSYICNQGFDVKEFNCYNIIVLFKNDRIEFVEC